MSGPSNGRPNKWHGYSGFLPLAALLLMTTAAHAADQQPVFPTPDKAVDALIFATRNDHTTELAHILGPGSERLVFSGDDVADNEVRDRFTAAYDKAHKIESGDNGTMILIVGDDEWPMPIPLVSAGKGWRFDAQTGAEEILARRIGRNEMNVIGVCRAYVEAQREFAAQHDGDYAQNFQSNDSKHDGLYWTARDGEAESPLGPLIASASAEGYSPDTALSKVTPYHGYYYKILKHQGGEAAGGAMDYVTNGRMNGGFALIAYPATYGDSGVMSFIVNQNGIVYEKNLGSDTANIALHMTDYDPDDSWQIVE